MESQGGEEKGVQLKRKWSENVTMERKRGRREDGVMVKEDDGKAELS